MSFLAQFMLENEAPPSVPSVSSALSALSAPSTSNVPSAVVSYSNKNLQTKVLIGGSIDWDNATNKCLRGLNETCKMDFEGRNVKQCYSSSSAHHAMFVVCESYGRELVYAMGRNDKGQLGTGNTITVQLPVKIVNPSKELIKKIATGRYHTLLLSEDGSLFACGANDCGQLGIGFVSEPQMKWRQVKTVLPVVDVSCGNQFSVFCDTAGHVYTFGHPESGQLGHGSSGEFIDKRKLIYAFTNSPKRIKEFITKDARNNKITSVATFEEVFIVAVSAGRNHGLCVESSQEQPQLSVHSSSNGKSNTAAAAAAAAAAAPAAPVHQGRVFSWGCGGYGRLGHNSTQDELTPRCIEVFANLCNSGHPTKPLYRNQCITNIIAGNFASVAITASKRMYLFGVINNTISKECNMYPKEVPELLGCSIDNVSFGYKCIYVLSGSEVFAWGASFGAMGFVESKTSTSPKEIDLRGVEALSVSCGYLHTCILVKDKLAVKLSSDKTNSNSGSSSETKKKGAMFAKAIEVTPCWFDSKSQVNSYFPLVEALSEVDPELRKTKKQKKLKQDEADDAENDVNNDASEGDSDSASGEGESSSEEEDDDDDDDDDQSDDGVGKGRNKRGGAVIKKTGSSNKKRK